MILGHIALGQLKRTGEQGRGLAVAGVVIGYVVLGFWVVVLLVLFVVPLVITLIATLALAGSSSYY